MKDPNDCTYPHTRLCLHNCTYGCAKRSPQRSGWRKEQIDDAEEEAWQEMTLKQGSLPSYQDWLKRDYRLIGDLLKEKREENEQ